MNKTIEVDKLSEKLNELTKEIRIIDSTLEKIFPQIEELNLKRNQNIAKIELLTELLSVNSKKDSS